MLSVRQRLNFLAVAIALFTCYSLFGILQEQIFKTNFVSIDGSSNGQFTFSITFVCLQCIFYAMFAKVTLLTREKDSNETHQGFYAATGVFYLVGLVTSNTALQFISYPSQVIGKALKPIPTMIFGCCVGGKSYPFKKYLLVFLIVIGAVMFLYTPALFNPQDSTAIGYCFVGVSLLMNGGTAGVQEKMRSVARPSPLNLMFYLNTWSAGFLIVAVIISQEFNAFLSFCQTYPDALQKIIQILIVGGVGQFFTCNMITSFGVVPCCLVLTLRKFFNVIFSVFYNDKVLDIRQWVAIAIIFGSLLIDTILTYFEVKNKKRRDESVCKNESNEKLREAEILATV